MKIESYKQLIVWQKSIELVKDIYSSTNKLPKSEIYGLSSQMRRAAISIPSNIAEGYRRKNRGEYIQFLAIASGSGGELETQLIIASETYPKIDFSKATNVLDEIMRMLNVMRSKLRPTPYSLHPHSHV